MASRSGGGESSTPPPMNFRTPPSRGDDFALNASEKNLAVEASASIRSDDPCAVNVSVSITVFRLRARRQLLAEEGSRMHISSEAE